MSDAPSDSQETTPAAPTLQTQLAIKAFSKVCKILGKLPDDASRIRVLRAVAILNEKSES